MKNPFKSIKNPFNKKAAQANTADNIEAAGENPPGEGAAGENLPDESAAGENLSVESPDPSASGEMVSSAETSAQSEKQFKAAQKAAKKAEAAEKKAAKKAKAAEKRAVQKAAKAEKNKAKAAQKATKKAAKPQKEKKVKVKLTKEQKQELKFQKLQLKQDKLIAKEKLKADKQAAKAHLKMEKMRARTKLKADKIRARVMRKKEKILLKQQSKADRKLFLAQQKAEKRQFKQELRNEIKAAKKDMPKSKLLFVMIPVLAILLVVSAFAVLGGRGIGPLSSANIPNPLPVVRSALPSELPGFLKSIKMPRIPFLSKIIPTNEMRAEAAVTGLFDSFVNLDFDRADKYIDMSRIVIPPEYLEFIDQETYMIATFERLEFEIIETERFRGSGDDDSSGDADSGDDSQYREYRVLTDITAVRAKALMASYIRDVLAYMFSSAMETPPPEQSQIDARIQAMFHEEASKEFHEMIINEVMITVRNIDGVWTVIPDEIFIDAIFGEVITTAGNFFIPDSPRPQRPARGSDSHPDPDQ